MPMRSTTSPQPRLVQLHPLVRLAGVERPRRRVSEAALAAAVLALCLFAILCGAHVDALDAAGAFADKGKAIGGIKTFVDAIRGNLIWVMSVVAGLAVALVGAMFMMGHTRAQDYAMKAGVGFLILAGGSGIVS